MRRESNAAVLNGIPERVSLPVANGEGCFYASEEVLADIEAKGLVAFRYVDESTQPTQAYPANPNGSLAAIAGLCDPSGRILGLMPHPERNVARHHHPDWRRRPADEVPDGVSFFESVLALC